MLAQSLNKSFARMGIMSMSNPLLSRSITTRAASPCIARTSLVARQRRQPWQPSLNSLAALRLIQCRDEQKRHLSDYGESFTETSRKDSNDVHPTQPSKRSARDGDESGQIFNHELNGAQNDAINRVIGFAAESEQMNQMNLMETSKSGQQPSQNRHVPATGPVQPDHAPSGPAQSPQATSKAPQSPQATSKAPQNALSGAKRGIPHQRVCLVYKGSRSACNIMVAIIRSPYNLICWYRRLYRDDKIVLCIMLSALASLVALLEYLSDAFGARGKIKSIRWFAEKLSFKISRLLRVVKSNVVNWWNMIEEDDENVRFTVSTKNENEEWFDQTIRKYATTSRTRLITRSDRDKLVRKWFKHQVALYDRERQDRNLFVYCWSNLDDTIEETLRALPGGYVLEGCQELNTLRIAVKYIKECLPGLTDEEKKLPSYWVPWSRQVRQRTTPAAEERLESIQRAMKTHAFGEAVDGDTGAKTDPENGKRNGAATIVITRKQLDGIEACIEKCKKYEKRLSSKQQATEREVESLRNRAQECLDDSKSINAKLVERVDLLDKKIEQRGTNTCRDEVSAKPEEQKNDATGSSGWWFWR